MCCRIKVRGHILKPGDRIPCKLGREVLSLPWEGFARSETLKETWSESTGALVDVEAYAEKNSTTGKHIWKDDRVTIKVIVTRGSGNTISPHVARIVTREATQEEKSFFGHDRVPLTDTP